MLLLGIINILVFDLGRLTNYGFGYLVGKILLFLLIAGVVYLSRKTKVAPTSTAGSEA